MRMDAIQLKHQSQLIKDYRADKEDVMEYFDYSPFGSYKQRVSDLQGREFKREELAKVLFTLNKEWDAPETTLDNIERLKDDKSVVVVGGQQAGLMTGPMYTINKIISIIQFAREQEKQLGIPVIPLFWIAGEDHDYEEINHIFLFSALKMQKHKLHQQVIEKESISNIDIDETIADEWLHKLFEDLKETEYTKDLYIKVKECLDQSETYVDFFARLIFQLFKEEGIVLIDSGHQEVRQLESSIFKELIEKQADISAAIHTAFQQLKQAGYTISLDVEKHDAHLFYYKDNERILLERNEAGEWVGKQNEVLLTTDEMMDIAKNNPELLSNNVVSRPLMQELLLPSLAFIGGAGEISYWAVLKSAFQLLNIKMPPVLPRLSLTYIDQNILNKLENKSISTIQAINDGVDDLKGNWLASQSNPPIHLIVEQMKSSINKLHSPLRSIAKDIRVDIGALADKNLDYIYDNINFLEGRMMQGVEDKYKQELATFDIINSYLHPHGGLQERVWNPFQLINEHGPYFIRQVVNESCAFEEEHYIVHL